jgi:subtilisin family serine protease
LLVRLVTVVVAAALLAILPATAQADPKLGSSSDADKIKPQLAQQLEQKDEASFWVRFEQADLTAASQVKDWNERGKAVYDALTSAADASQGEALGVLDKAGASYQAFYATNAIRVDAGDRALVNELAGLEAVQSLWPTREYAVEEPIKGKDVKDVNAVEWGVANINADDVWSEFGVTGEGITVANIDTGVQYDHPALVGKYRGNNGDGTFDHNYNWFNAAGACSTAPCDTNGHGTHTMGTMLGDDGGANQVGVAPGAKWIAANGCCPSDGALISSGQWMLAPTDLDGNNPDITKRPNIVNNSWGTQVPSNDPFMEDILIAWKASGIFGTWSNGNNGPGCQTSGSPGSRIINYSVGAYDSGNNIAGFSSRGAGQDGEIKPNISAPGVNVRSSLPGSTYGAFNGTSMAAPHLAGAIALLWSAAPSLVGDIDATWALLDGTAVDSSSTGCGGTADDNNVFGEGRLDALALLQAAPVGDTGEVVGTVTDATTGDPIEGAEVELVSGDTSRTLTTGADGTYSVRLNAGEYAVTASSFGYETQTANVTVTAGETVTQDFALATAAMGTVVGSVSDGSGHDWPLYSKLTVEGAAPDGFSDPSTGEFSLTLPVGTYSVTVAAQYPGYEPETREITVTEGQSAQDFVLEVDSTTCLAPGYAFNTTGSVTEDFNEGALPEGWTIEDNLGNGQVWRFDDPENRGNLTGGDGTFAISDSDFYGSSGSQDTSLVSPVVDMSGMSDPVVAFKQDFNALGDLADVDVSVDGGETWETVLSQTVDVRGPREDIIPLPMAAGESDVQIRFHHHEADFDWWWQVDDFSTANRSCDPVRGGLVVGNVRGATGRAGINGATVTSLDQPEEKAVTAATPDDPGLDDGFYWMFSSLTGRHPFEAKANQHGTHLRQVNVAADWSTTANFRLAAAKLTVTPASLSTTSVLGATAKSKTFTVTNEGNAPANLEFSEQPGGFLMQTPDGARVDTDTFAGDQGAPLQEIKADVTFASLAKGMGSTGSPAAPVGPNEAPWTDIADYPSTVMDNRVVYVDGVAYSIGGGSGSSSYDTVYAYDPATLAWIEKASLPGARNAMAVGAVNGQIVATGGWAAAGPSPDTWVYDPAADAWTEGADAPVNLSAAGQAVVDGKLYVVGGCTTSACTPMSNDVAAYDPASNSWEQLADYPAPAAFASCGGIDGLVYCTGGNGGAGGTADSYVYDPGADSWSEIPDAPIDTWASAFAVANGKLVVNGGVQGGLITNRTFAFNPETEAWEDLPNSNTARYRGGAACGLYKIGGSSGSFNATVDSEMLPGFEECASGAADVEWMTINRTSATLDPGESVVVRVTMDPHVAQPGTYTAGVAIKEDAPGSLDPVAVTMKVNAPLSWGKLAGVVTSSSCTGVTAPLPGATVQIDSYAGSWTFSTEADGSYAYWFSTAANPLDMITSKDGYVPQARRVRVYRGEETQANFTLRKAGC